MEIRQMSNRQIKRKVRCIFSAYATSPPDLSLHMDRLYVIKRKEFIEIISALQFSVSFSRCREKRAIKFARRTMDSQGHNPPQSKFHEFISDLNGGQKVHTVCLRV
jgi:hypothetical protein